MLNTLINAEFDAFIGASRYEHTNKRATQGTDKLYRMGTRTRRFDTTAGTLTLTIPRPNRGGYVPSFLPRYKRYAKELKKTIVEAYANGVSTCKMMRLIDAMGINGISQTQVSRIVAETNKTVDAFRCRSLHDTYFPVLFIDATFQKIRTEDGTKLMPVLIVMGLDPNTRKQDVLSIEIFPEESTKSYTALLTKLKQRGLESPKLIISDGHSGIINAIKDVMPGAKWQLCQAHFARSVLSHVKDKDAQKRIGKELVLMWHSSTHEHAVERAIAIYERYKYKYPAAMRSFANDNLSVMDTLTFLNFEDIPMQMITTSNRIERMNLELRRRTQQVGTFPNVESCLRLNTLVCMEYVKTEICSPLFSLPQTDDIL
jgi:transposase-like protein